MTERFAVIGGAGFIGHHLSHELLRSGNKVLVVDNFCSGNENYLKGFKNHPNFSLARINVEDTNKLTPLLAEVDTVVHLASNPDISKAVLDPRIDFVQGTVLTESVIEASRKSGVNTILYASGSGVYGDGGENILTEISAVNPISTYGASKLAGESLLSAYSFMFGVRSVIFRFANVVGSKQTHGVGFDFLNKLSKEKTSLRILGDGKQRKSYVHISDLISGLMLAYNKSEQINNVYNISTNDQLSVDEIAFMAVEAVGLNPDLVKLDYEGGNRGWKGDVPVVRLSSDKLTKLGWKPNYSSREAMKSALTSMSEEMNE